MRLTEKTCGINPNRKYCSSADNINLVNKLGQYEDNDEMLGIDYNTLVEALKNGIYVRNSQGIRRYDGNANSYLSFGYDIFMKSFYFTMKVKGVQQYFIKDYGKTWALTKEELEND